MSIKYIILFFLFLFFNQIFCNTNNTKKQQEINSSIPLNNTFKNNETKKIIDSKKSFNMTIDEMDTMLLCTVIVQESTKKYESKIKQIQKRLNTSNNIIGEKISTDIFEKCNKNINIKTVNYYIKNLTFMNTFKWEKSFDEIIKIDFNKYKNETDLEYTMDQHILMYKFEKVEEIYKQKRIEDRGKYEKENQKIRIGKVDLDKIPSSFKLGIFLTILILFFGGIFYFLKTLQKKPKEKKKKKKAQ